MKKTIGIPGYAGRDSKNFGVANTYLKFASEFGNPRIIMPWEEKVDVDLLLLPGGLDTAPSNYGQIPSFDTSNQDVFKEFFFKERLKNYIGNTPIFGICLGFQQLCVYFGSELKQDLMYHAQSQERGALAHYVYESLIYKDVKDNDTGEMIYKCVKQKRNHLEFKVNSHHHQAVLSSTISHDLNPLLFAKMYGYDHVSESIKIENDNVFIVEAMHHRELPIAGVQWHPEEIYDFYSRELILKLLKGE